MKRKGLAFLMVLVVAAFLLPVMAGAEEHVHSYDHEYHEIWWRDQHNAYCECGEWVREDHIYDEDGLCPCGYEKPIEHEHDWQCEFQWWFHWLECSICHQRQDTIDCDGCVDTMCSVCGNYPQRHPDTNRDCHCDVCNWEFDHGVLSTWDYDNENHWNQCFCGKTKENIEAHTLVNGVCSVCDYVYTTCEHPEDRVSYVRSTEMHNLRCELCDTYLDTWEKHCFIDGVCICGQKENCTHENKVWLDDGEYHYAACEDCFELFDDIREKHSIKFGRCIYCGHWLCTHENTETKWWSRDDDYHQQACLYCGIFLDGTESEHTLVDGACTVCEYAVNCSHEDTYWYHDQTGHTQVCSICEWWIGEFKTHTMVDGKCTVCGYAPCPDGEHALYTGRTYAHVCLTCGYEVDSKDENCDGLCDCCGQKKVCFHENSTWICDSKFDPYYHYQKCSDCQGMLMESWSEHTPVNGVCSVCGYECETVTLGDPNGDGKINAKDATLILQYSVGVLKENQNFDAAAADVSGDGKLNAKDATLILQFSVGLRDSFPAG